jgi:hypothetical protein
MPLERSETTFHFDREHNIDVHLIRPLKMSRLKRALVPSVSLRIIVVFNQMGIFHYNSYHIVRCYHPSFYDYRIF